ncbi:MAG: histidine phosphatase family protein [Burkholderiales bacterium]|nr:histidine phosphatase family protein [Burkholderiales bacterium]
MTILLIRHGETPLNAARVIQPPDTPLSARGEAQAEAVARRVAAMGIAGILASDLARAQMTAAPIAAATGLAIESDPLLRERNFGALRGQAFDQFDFDPIAMEDAPPGGESAAAFRARVAQALALIAAVRNRLGAPLAVVTHGLVIRTIVERLVRVADGATVPAHLANTSVTVLSAAAPHDASLVYCAAHLAGDAIDHGRGRAGL